MLGLAIEAPLFLLWLAFMQDVHGAVGGTLMIYHALAGKTALAILPQSASTPLICLLIFLLQFCIITVVVFSGLLIYIVTKPVRGPNP